MLLPLSIIEYAALVIFGYCGILTLNSPADQTFLLPGAVALAVFIFFFLINKQVAQNSQKSEIMKNAELYNTLSNIAVEGSLLAPARAKALQYCDELVKDYKKTRSQARTLYYILQLSTIVFSGLTPILVLVDKLESGVPWLKWLPVIFPAIASIVASVVTSFPFQELAIASNTTVELLEAEQEKFILGVGQTYRAYDAVNEAEQQQKSMQAIENFIIEVNNIHLKQVQSQNQNQPSSNSDNESTAST